MRHRDGVAGHVSSSCVEPCKPGLVLGNQKRRASCGAPALSLVREARISSFAWCDMRSRPLRPLTCCVTRATDEGRLLGAPLGGAANWQQRPPSFFMVRMTSPAMPPGRALARAGNLGQESVHDHPVARAADRDRRRESVLTATGRRHQGAGLRMPMRKRSALATGFLPSGALVQLATGFVESREQGSAG